LNTISSDELKDFADMLESDDEPTLCLVNLRLRKDVSWFVQVVERLRVKRGYAFVSFVNSYVGDVYQALMNMEQPVTNSLVILRRVPYNDAMHVIAELSDRFGFYPDESQRQDIYKWSYGHVGLLRTLYLLKRQSSGRVFTRASLLREPTVLERLTNIVRDIPQDKMHAILQQKLSFIEKMFYEELGFIDASGELFHPLLAPLIPQATVQQATSFSITENKVLNYLRNHPDVVVSRVDIAQLVWGEEEWEDKYSDWAIGQLIYRLRKKLEYSSLAGEIQTKKGQGFIYSAPLPGNSSASRALTNRAASSMDL
jgi:DNA-binding winged helix-turn-helix (wHTH) protein